MRSEMQQGSARALGARHEETWSNSGSIGAAGYGRHMEQWSRARPISVKASEEKERYQRPALRVPEEQEMGAASEGRTGMGARPPRHLRRSRRGRPCDPLLIITGTVRAFSSPALSATPGLTTARPAAAARPADRAVLPPAAAPPHGLSSFHAWRGIRVGLGRGVATVQPYDRPAALTKELTLNLIVACSQTHTQKKKVNRRVELNLRCKEH